MDRPQRSIRFQRSAEGPPVEVKIAPAGDVPVLYANHIQSTFTGNEFLISLVGIFPEPPQQQKGGKPLPASVMGKVLGRYAIGIPQWVMLVKSFSAQIDRLQKEGIFHLEYDEGALELVLGGEPQP